MAASEQQYKFPDEQGGEVEVVPEVEIEVVDDTPPADRGRQALPEEIVKELEADDLEEYSDKVKKRLGQMKKVWHDERRAKETATREREEAMRYAEAKDGEVRQLKQQLGAGTKLYVEEITKGATVEITGAKERLKQAYESGDSSAIADAQEELTDAKIKLQRYKDYRQEPTDTVEAKPQAKAPQLVADPKAENWRQRNTWFGADEEMTALALGLHEKLVRSGVDPRSDDYYDRVNETMRKRFPENFEDEVSQPRESVKTTPRKSANVVAPATRSTAPKKVSLTQTQMAIAKKFNLTPEAYAHEVLKLENNNG